MQLRCLTVHKNLMSLINDEWFDSEVWDKTTNILIFALTSKTSSSFCGLCLKSPNCELHQPGEWDSTVCTESPPHVWTFTRVLTLTLSSSRRGDSEPTLDECLEFVTSRRRQIRLFPPETNKVQVPTPTESVDELHTHTH